MRQTFIRTGFVLGLILCFSLIPFTREKSEETTSEVPELTAFHEIIYPIWHTAYPEKDYAALRSFVPQVNELAAQIYTAVLPGILRDKEAKWREGVALFRKAVEDYTAAASGEDNDALLIVAEALHFRYESLVKLIRPVLKEIDEFHKVLYVVYHKFLPDQDYANIQSVSEDMALKAEAITRAALPKRLESKAEPFKTASTELLESVKELASVGSSEDKAAIEKAVEKIHTKYQALEKIF
ncbi:MAG: hypothetical protein WCC06_06300 [Candidatus Aminicenantales bacterium]